MKDMIAYCGLDCEKCDAYIATKNNDDALREKTSKLWSEWNGIHIPPEQINCGGCRGDGIKTVYCSGLCPVRKCASGKGFASCGECEKMESCPDVGIIVSNNEAAYNNLKNRVA